MTAGRRPAGLVVPFSVAERLGAGLRARLANAGALGPDAPPEGAEYWADQVQALLLSARQEIAALAAAADAVTADVRRERPGTIDGSGYAAMPSSDFGQGGAG